MVKLSCTDDVIATIVRGAATGGVAGMASKMQSRIIFKPQEKLALSGRMYKATDEGDRS